MPPLARAAATTCGAVGRQHHRAACRHLGDVVHEDDTQVDEPLDDPLVVHDLVVAVHRRFKRADHPRKRLDRHLHPSTKAPWRGEQHQLYALAAGLAARPTLRRGIGRSRTVDC